MSVQDLICDLVKGEVRPHSPKIRPVENQAPQRSSPNSPLSPIPSTASSPTDQHGPAAPCHCGAGTYHQTDPGGAWLCSACSPSTGIPAATPTVPGGQLPSRRQDVEAIIREAVLGLSVTAEEFRAWCEPADLADIAAGHIPVATVRAYAMELVRQGPRELGTTVGGVTVRAYQAVPTPAINKACKRYLPETP